MTLGTGSERVYVERRDDGFWIQDTRISLDSIVHAFKQGVSPDSIQRSYPLLTLEQVFGAIAYYLANAEELDDYLEQSERELDSRAQALNAAARSSNPGLFYRLDAERRRRRTFQT